MRGAFNRDVQLQIHRFALIGTLTVAFCAAVFGGQNGSKAKPNLPAGPPAKTSQPATHFTQGTIASIGANQMVITRKVRGKEDRLAFSLNSRTLRSGNLVAGSRVSVQYQEGDSQKIAAAVRELPTKARSKS